MPFEWFHMLEGRADELDRQRRVRADWLSPILSALAGQAVTPAMLLGEGESAMTEEQKVRAAQKKLEKTMKQLKNLK